MKSILMWKQMQCLLYSGFAIDLDMKTTKLSNIPWFYNRYRYENKWILKKSVFFKSISMQKTTALWYLQHYEWFSGNLHSFLCSINSNYWRTQHIIPKWVILYHYRCVTNTKIMHTHVIITPLIIHSFLYLVW